MLEVKLIIAILGMPIVILTVILNSYVDNGKLLRAIKIPGAAVSLSSDTDLIYKWAEENHMLINTIKHQIVLFPSSEILRDRFVQ